VGRMKNIYKYVLVLDEAMIGREDDDLGFLGKW
jgi:hypothetical protein